MLDIRNLSKSFNPPRTGPVAVLDRVNFSLSPGDTLAVIGHSGSGKTTLLSLIAGLDRPDAGAILLNGTDITTLDQAGLTRYRAEQIGMIFQAFHLMPHLTARENIRLPLEILAQKDKKRIPDIEFQTREMLEKVGLAHRARHLPGQLSGGECQRVAIARALVTKPALILADEPTGNLDAASGEIVAGLLFDLVDSFGKTLVLVTHNRDLAGLCRTRKTLARGRLS